MRHVVTSRSDKSAVVEICALYPFNLSITCGNESARRSRTSKNGLPRRAAAWINETSYQGDQDAECL